MRPAEIELFAGLSTEQLAWVESVGVPQVLRDGEVLFEDGEQARFFYVLLTGQLLITKMMDGREHVLSRHRADVRTQPDDKPPAANRFTGELPLLAGGGYVAKATAVGETRLLTYDRDTFLEMLSRCPQVCQVLLPVLAWRIRSYEAHAGRRAMLQGLGTLTAGLTHELNNPAAAVARAAAELRGATASLASWASAWGAVASAREQEVVASVAARPPAPPADAFEAALLADDVCDWLSARGIDSTLDTVLADHGLTVAVLDSLDVRAEALPAAVGFLSFSLHCATLVRDVAEAGARITALLESAKQYSDLDRAPQRVADITEGLEATLTMQAPKLTRVRIHRSYAALPPLTVYPSELNQVWTNLIDNAVDAMSGAGELRVSTVLEADCVIVEITDSGCGIPDSVRPRLFQPFFTTKDIGKGTGLGLHLCHSIVARHNGSIDVTSVPGETTFAVRLPLG